MKDKFTLRDFFAYFLSGIVIFIFVFLNYRSFLVDFLKSNQASIKEFSALIIFFSIPTAYFLGQILHGLDSIFHQVAISSRKIRVLKKKPYNLKYLVIYLLNAYRVSGKLFLKGEEAEKFWQDCAKLQVDKNFSACEYWYVMNDLFKGLFLGAGVFFIVSVARLDWPLIGLYAFLVVLFWFRALFFAGSFIDTVKRTKRYSTTFK